MPSEYYLFFAEMKKKRYFEEDYIEFLAHLVMKFNWLAFLIAFLSESKQICFG